MFEEGLVREILSDGTLCTEEIKRELKKNDICFVQSYDRTLSGLFVLLAALWLLPAIARWTGWGFLRFFVEFPRVDFPIGVILGAAVLFNRRGDILISALFDRFPAGVRKILTSPQHSLKQGTPL